MRRFSANLGFLWAELALPEAIIAAKQAGFDAVECHWPYETDPELVKKALKETGLSMIGLNTIRGNLDRRENGLSALPGRETEAQTAIDQAIEYAVAIDAKSIHVMAGFAQGNEALNSFVGNLIYACSQAVSHDITILIEPLNHYDAPDYFLQDTDQANEIIQAVQAPNLKLMFDCYHIQIMQGDISRRLQALKSIIGHIQIASVPDRAEPDAGELNYQHILRVLDEIGFDQPIGAEYRPRSTVQAGLGWMDLLR